MTEQDYQRRLAAILAADVVGYSRLMERDERGTHARLRALMTDIVQPEIAAHGGRLFKTTGDGLLAEFAAAADAVDCALGIQEKVTAHQTDDADDADDTRIRYRIGVSLGDVILEGGDVFGDGVNIAARLEGLADPGGVSISGPAHAMLRGAAGEAFEDLGDRSVKNIERPIRVWRWRQAPAEAPQRPKATAGTTPLIAVIPFTVAQGDDDGDALAQGLADDIVTGFARRRGVGVVARETSAQYRGRGGEIAEIRSKLGADYVLTGAIRRAGDKVRVTAELLETDHGKVIWSERYDGELSDPFALQDRLVGLIATAARAALNANEGLRTADRPEDQLTQADRRARAATYFYQFTRDAYDRAAQELDIVLAADPNDATALAMRAFCMWYRNMYDDALLDADALDRAKAMADRAVELDKTNDYVFATRGNIALHLLGDHQAAIADARRSLEISPHYGISRALLGSALAYAGKPEDGIPIIENAIAATPRDPTNFARYWMLAMARFGAEDYQAALDDADKALQTTRELPALMAARIAILVRLGRSAEAREEAADLLARHPGLTVTRLQRPPFKRPEEERRFLDALRDAGLPE